MSHSPVLTSVRRLRSLLAAQEGEEHSDEQLLTAFADHRDEIAFATLVRRHGPMVLGVCRRVLGHVQDAEDASQATFLVLARRAAALRNKTALPSFLHGTAFHLSSKIKRAAGRRRKHEGRAPSRLWVDPSDDLLWSEVRALLDEETARLPDAYRTIFVLCCLENLSQAEAGRRLGLKERTVSNRLAEARKRLSQRLRCRGVELTAVLAATTLATSSSSAFPAEMMATTIQAALATAAGKELSGLASPSVAQLVQGVGSAVTLSKAKIAAVLLLTATLLAGAGAWMYHTLATPQPDEKQQKKPDAASRAGQGQKADTPRKEQSETRTVSGRVLDPDGKPVQGARLYWPRVPKTEPKSEEDIEIPQRATTDADGRFRFELPRSDIRSDWNLTLVAASDGFGVDAVELPKGDSPAEVTLRLVKDQPIEGRIVNTEGKPLAGVQVRALELSTTQSGNLDDFLTAWKQEWRLAFGQLSRHMSVLLPLDGKASNAVTDKDGRFRIRGAGSERLVKLSVSSPGFGHEILHIINRAGFNAAPVNKAVLDRIPAELRQPGQPPLLYGPKVEYVAPASRRIEGTVREAGSGNPVAGITIHCGFGYSDGVEAVSDKDGRYKLEGIPKMKQYLLNAWPPEGSAWLGTGARRDDEEGLRPFQINFTVTRGIVVSGRVLDRTTGKGVQGGIRFVPIAGNKFAGRPGYDSYNYDRTVRGVKADGRFQLPIIPGPGVLMVQVYGNEKANGGLEVNPYKQAEFDAQDRKHVKLTEDGEDRFFTSIGDSIEFLSSENVVKYLDLAPDAGTAKCDLFVDRGTTRTIQIEDPEGKPLTGTTLAGMTAMWPKVSTIKDANCTIFALDPKKPRSLFFFHSGRNLAGSLMVRGDDKEPLTVRLVPVGSMTGRLLDREGQPIAGAFVDLNPPDGVARELYRHLNQRRPQIRTDKDGRFRIDGIVPDVKFMLSISQGRTFLVGEPRIGLRQVKPGQTLDLGAIRVKPGG
ncbi:MAG TPA: sigma-70 family RNA polymerase sigma factor [Gemmataceae bacterium]